MSALEIRLLVYGVLALLMVWGIHTLDVHHYERIMQAQELARDAMVQKAQTQVIAAQAAQRAAEDRAAQEIQKREQADIAIRDTVVGGLRSLETAVHARLVFPAMGNSGAIQGSLADPAGDPRLPEFVARLNASFDRLIAACQHEYEERAAILSLEPQVSP